jgi:hypothetical protein
MAFAIIKALAENGDSNYPEPEAIVIEQAIHDYLNTNEAVLYQP